MVASCIADRGKRATASNAGEECLERCARHLRECIDAAFPDSKKIELEGDKVNYVHSSVVFLSNKLSKASQGLVEFDKVMGNIEKAGKASLEERKIGSYP
jgi:hypothetical protein